jgi:hypothetical protein
LELERVCPHLQASQLSTIHPSLRSADVASKPKRGPHQNLKAWRNCFSVISLINPFLVALEAFIPYGRHVVENPIDSLVGLINWGLTKLAVHYDAMEYFSLLYSQHAQLWQKPSVPKPSWKSKPRKLFFIDDKVHCDELRVVHSVQTINSERMRNV